MSVDVPGTFFLYCKTQTPHNTHARNKSNEEYVTAHVVRSQYTKFLMYENANDI